MGQYMKSKINKTLTFFICIGVFSFLSCMKKPDHTPDFGPSVEAEKVQSALDEVGTVDPVTIKKCEFVSIDTYKSYDTITPAIIKQTAKTVTNVKEETDKYIFTVIKATKILSEGTWKDPVNETLFLELSKGTEASSSNNVSTTNFRNNETGVYSKLISNLKLSIKNKFPYSQSANDGFIFHKLDGRTGVPGTYTFHNLKKEYTTVPIPIAVKNSANCGGLDNCERPLRAIKVSVDQVYWETADKGDKITFQYIATPDAPFFASKLSTCAQAWVDYQGRVISITECDEVSDFKFGDSSLKECNSK